MGAEEPSLRLFFALWPPNEVAQALHQLARRMAGQSGGRVMARDTLHLTLAFLGQVHTRRLAELRAAAEATPLPGAFDLTLDHLGYWRHKHLLWAGCTTPPTALATLARGLGETLRARGFSLEARPFHPHLTLLRKAAQPLAFEVPILPPWRVTELVLVSSRTTPQGPHYPRLERWALGSGGLLPT